MSDQHTKETSLRADMVLMDICIQDLCATNAALLKALKDIELASDVNKYFHVRNIARAAIQQAESWT